MTEANTTMGTTLDHRPARVSAGDRLGLTLFFAAALHAIIILGISFRPDEAKRPDVPLTMEVTLVHSHSDKAPEKADYLAQANQEGGGNVKEKVRPSSPFAHVRPTRQKGEAPTTRPEVSPPPKPPRKAPSVLSTERPSDMRAQIVPPKQESPHIPESVTGAELIRRSREVARLSAEIRQQQQAYARKPRHKYVTANTREHVAAMYEEAWRAKVERIGNLNYPDEAKRTHLSGSLILDVAINADGSLHEIKVVRSSGHKVLDDGAARIVRLGAPYAPLPAAIRKQADVLHIIRSWEFHSDNRLQTFGG